MGILLDILSGISGGWDALRPERPRSPSLRQQLGDQQQHRTMERNFDQFRHQWNAQHRADRDDRDGGWGWRW